MVKKVKPYYLKESFDSQHKAPSRKRLFCSKYVKVGD